MAKTAIDSNAIRDRLMGLLAANGAGDLGERVEIELVQRNAFCVRFGEDQPIFTVRVDYGGALTRDRQVV